MRLRMSRRLKVPKDELQKRETNFYNTVNLNKIPLPAWSSLALMKLARLALVILNFQRQRIFGYDLKAAVLSLSGRVDQGYLQRQL